MAASISLRLAWTCSIRDTRSDTTARRPSFRPLDSTELPPPAAFCMSALLARVSNAAGATCALRLGPVQIREGPNLRHGRGRHFSLLLFTANGRLQMAEKSPSRGEIFVV